jgi:hypothetical protein
VSKCEIMLNVDNNIQFPIDFRLNCNPRNFVVNSPEIGIIKRFPKKE